MEPFQMQLGIIEMKLKWGRELNMDEECTWRYVCSALSGRVPKSYFK